MVATPFVKRKQQDCFIALFQAGQRFERKLDRQRCDGSHQTLGNGVVERL
jgi:hypothetical protein